MHLLSARTATGSSVWLLLKCYLVPLTCVIFLHLFCYDVHHSYLHIFLSILCPLYLIAFTSLTDCTLPNSCLFLIVNFKISVFATRSRPSIIQYVISLHVAWYFLSAHQSTMLMSILDVNSHKVHVFYMLVYQWSQCVESHLPPYFMRVSTLQAYAGLRPWRQIQDQEVPDGF